MLPFELTKDTPYLALSGELWSVFYEYFNRNWPCYKGFLLYVISSSSAHGQICAILWQVYFVICHDIVVMFVLFIEECMSVIK